MKRRERKHLKEDEFVSTMTKLVRFFRQYQREIKIVALSLMAVILLLAFIRVIQVRGVSKANQQLATILKLNESLREKIASGDSGEAEPSELKELEKMAGSGRYARLAYLYLATYWVAKNDLSRAQAYLEKFPPEPRDLFYFQAKDLLGEILIWRQQFDQAINLYESLQKEKNIPYTRDTIWLHLAEALEKKGEKKRAVEIYRQLQKEYPYSAYLWNVADRLRRLGG